MRYRVAIAAGLLAGLSLISSQANAQMYGAGPLGRPRVSPYTNMVFADALGQVGIGGGYQTLVRPFVDGRRATDANSADIARLQGQMAAGAGGRGGYGASRFMNFSHYYQGR
jgi:hypothetical protein